MHHLIHGVRYNLREMTQYELDALVAMTQQRIAAAEDDLEKLVGEQIRRSSNVIPLRWDRPEQHGWDPHA